MYRTAMAALVAAVFVSQARAEEGLLPAANPALQTWPALSAAKTAPKPTKMSTPAPQAEGKSPRRAFLLSAIFPGAGEFYAGAPKRAIGFAAVEVLALGAYFTWKGKGDDIEQEFRAVANADWDPVAYLEWRTSTRASRFSSITHALPCSSFVAEGGALPGSLKDCSGRETQQYYELIGKYNQFIAGWEDVVRTDSNSPVQPTDIDSVESFSSQKRFAYEIQRDDSNKNLKRASNVLGLILVNHALSAIDAARAARMRNGDHAEAVEERVRLSLVLPPERQRPTMLMAYKPFY
ncbi:MAG: hypothetical protein IT369_20135 [Candidatus Latescibacteria bacterium]|nr:hypothetical protein [Candidatus Latescibacterota bacterium]